jgi:SAM-dependent methyltransferase
MRAFTGSDTPDFKRYWLDAGERRGPLAVIPSARWAAWEGLQRVLIQRWAIRQLLRHADTPLLTRTLELGSGIGDFSLRLARVSHELRAYDLAPGFVEQTRARLAGVPGVTCAVADIESFDDYTGATAVVIGGVLLYLDEPSLRRVLGRLRAQLRPGALVYQRDYVCRPGVAPHRGHAAAYYRHASFYRALFAEHGFLEVAAASSPGLFIDQVAHDTLGLRSDKLAAALAWAPARVTAWFMRRQPGYSWSALYRACG